MKMKKVVFTLCAVSGYLVLAVAIMLFDSSPVAGQSNSPFASPEVRVINSSAEPVPVFDVDNSAIEPFQVQINVSEDPFPPLAVPEGKRLVIEHVVSGAFCAADICFFNVFTTVGGRSATHSFAMSNVGVVLTDQNVYAMAAQTRIYADPGTFVSFSNNVISSEAPRPITSSVTISGYLVDVP